MVTKTKQTTKKSQTRINVYPSDIEVEQTHFSDRRKRKRQEQQAQYLQSLWRTLIILALAGGGFWVATLPEWKLRSSNQIKISGNRLISSQSLQKLIPLVYPQSIFRIQPQEIANQLEKLAPVKFVTVERILFPAQLSIKLQERQPVAVYERSGQEGLLDADGMWLPLSSYPQSLTKPKLSVIGGMSDSLIQANWLKIYAQLNQLSVQVSQVDWRDSGNLILLTELGNVHCGFYSSAKFLQQVAVLNQLKQRDFTKELATTRLASNRSYHIDLSDPHYPLLEGKALSQKNDLVN